MGVGGGGGGGAGGRGGGGGQARTVRRWEGGALVRLHAGLEPPARLIAALEAALAALAAPAPAALILAGAAEGARKGRAAL